MKQFDLAPRAWTNNWEMAFAFALPAGVGLFASVQAYYGSLLVSTVMGAVSLVVTGWLVLSLMRPIPGVISVGPTELRVSGGSFRASVPLEQVELADVRQLTDGLPKQAAVFFVTTSRNAVLIPLRTGSCWVVSPKDPERFVNALLVQAASVVEPV